jgi:hypothetical protein
MRAHNRIGTIGLLTIVFMLSGCGGETSKSGVDATMDAPETLVAPTCVGDQVLWEEHNACAPQVDECPNPWELPLVGGGCTAVGPRACPRLWDSESTEECEPGELMDCPAGFVLNDDDTACLPLFEDECAEDELAELGGGCRRIGPAADLDNTDMTFDDCPEGYLAVLGGNCAIVGPRACPKAWAPAAEIHCDIGDILPCPDGWEESEDALHCEPIYHVCPEGQRPLLGGGCEKVCPTLDQCPAATFATAPDGAAEVLYVLAESECEQDCGPEAAPYATIMAAVEAISPAGAVLVGPGTYDEGILLNKDVTLLGTCPGNTRVTGSVPLPEGEDSEMPAAALVVMGETNATIAGLALSTPAVGAYVNSTGTVTLRDLEFADNFHAALQIDGGEVLLESSWIHGTRQAVKGTGGEGLFVSGQATVSATDCLVEKTTRAGIQATGAGTHLALVDCTLRDTEWDDGGHKGSGLRVEGGAQVQTDGCVLERNRSVAVRAADAGSSVHMRRNVVRFTMMQEEGTFGAGVQASGGATVVLEESLLAGNRFAGVISWDPESPVTLERSVIRDTGPDTTGTKGRGASAMGGVLVARGSTFTGNMESGIGAEGSGAKIDVAWSRIAGTVASDTLLYGEGVLLANEALGILSHTLLEGNRGEAMNLNNGAEGHMTSSVLRDSLVLATGTMGWGLDVYAGASATLVDCLLERNRGFGLRAEGDSTVANLQRCEIRGTTPDETNDGGPAAAVILGAQLGLASSRVSNNSAVGLFVSGTESQADVADTIIADTVTLELWEQSGQGMEVSSGARVAATDTLFLRNKGLNVNLSGQESSLSLTGCNIRDTGVDGTGIWGIGLLVSNFSTAEASGLLVVDSPNFGIRVDEGSLKLSKSLVRRTRADSQAEGMAAFLVIGDAQADVEWSMLEDARFGGFVSQEPLARLSVRHSVVRNMKECAGAGLGAISFGGQTRLSGLLIEDAAFTGIAAQGQGALMHAAGSIVRNTYGLESGDYGEGAVAVYGSKLEVHHSLFMENAAAGVMVADQGTFGDIASSAVLRTHKGGTTLHLPDGSKEQQVHGDGVVVALGGHANIDSSLFSGNTRTGLYFAESTGTLTGNVIMGNESFGLAIDNTVHSVDYDNGTNFFLGNSTSLPPGIAAEVTTNPEGLPLPKAIDVSSVPVTDL